MLPPARLVVPPALGLLLLIAGCSEPPADASGDAAPVVVESQPGIRFDPGRLRQGDAVGDLVADSVAARRSAVDSTHVGSVTFRGRLQLSGRLMEHPEADLRETVVCFEADAASAGRMPRWRHDARRPWFCFVNPADARRALAPSDSVTSMTIVIEGFTIHRGLTDEVNTARFAHRVRS